MCTNTPYIIGSNLEKTELTQYIVSKMGASSRKANTLKKHTCMENSPQYLNFHMKDLLIISG